MGSKGELCLKISIPYNQRSFFKSFHDSTKRFKIAVCHRRAGKTVAAINELVKTVLLCDKPNPRGAYIAPTFSQAKDIAWTYLKEYTRNIPGCKYFESDLRVDFPGGARIKLYGSENEDRLRGLYFDIAVIDEFASMSPKIWEEVVRPGLSDRQGKAIFLGTPKGHDAFYDLWQDAIAHPEEWYSLMLRASETGILPPEELAANFRLMDEATYQREFECAFDAPAVGAYYAREIALAYSEKRVKTFSYDRELDTYACMDLGISDKMALWTFQLNGEEWRWLNYYENTGFGLDHYVNWMKKLPYDINELFLPHDAKVKELQTGESRQLYLEKRGFRTFVCTKKPIEDGINAVRMKFNQFWFNETGTIIGINAVRMYQAVEDSRNRILSRKPLHNWASHANDAMRTGVMGIKEAGLRGFIKSDWKKPITRPGASYA